MKNTLRWKIPGQEFEDGSQLNDWHKIESSPWHLQFESNVIKAGKQDSKYDDVI